MNIVTAATLLVVFLCDVSSPQEYVIKRQARDIFVIPRSLCSAISNQCYKMGAYQRYKDGYPVDCTCQCSVFSVVFGFFKNTWKCQSNADVRTHAECSNLGVSKAGNPLIVMPQLWNNLVISTYPGSNCKLQNQFSYLDCHGAWRQMYNAGVGFSIEKYSGSSYMYYLNSLGSYNTTLYGRVIKLNIGCTDPEPKSYCVVLKVRGTLICPVKLVPTTTSQIPSSTGSFSPPPPPPSSSSSSSSSTPSQTPLKTVSTVVATPSSLSSSSLTTTTTTTTTTTSSSSSHTPLMTMSTVVVTSLSSSLQLPSTSSIQPTLSTSAVRHPSLPTTTRTSTKVITESTTPPLTTEQSLKDDKKSTTTADNTSIIAGTVVGVVALVVMVVILLIIKMKRKRNSASERTDVTRVEDNIYDQPLDNRLTHTGQQSSNENQYDYAYAAVIRNRDQATRQISDINSSPPIPEFPVYNTLEDPDYVKSEPVYNVLEEPEAEGTNEESNYDVVGGIISTDAPVYAVLEGPHEGQHVYESLNSSNIAARDLNRGYNNVVYESTGDSIPLSERKAFPKN